MKKIIFNILAILILMTFNLKADETLGGSANVIQHAYCDCDGIIEVFFSDNCPINYPNPIPYRIFIDDVEVETGTYPKGSSHTVTLTDLCPGDYFIKAEIKGPLAPPLDWNVMAYETVTINGPDEFLDLINLGSGPNFPACYGEGYIEFEVTGGTEPITITWEKDGEPFTAPGTGDGRFEGLEEGSYTITVTDANGCTDTETFYVGETMPEVDFDVEFSPSGCDGEESSGWIKAVNCTPCPQMQIEMNGPNPPYTPKPCNEIWDNLEAGTYYLRARCDYGGVICYSDEKIVVIGEVFEELYFEETVYRPKCNSSTSKGSIVIDVISGTPPYQYDWSHDSNNNTNTAENLEAGTYTVTVTDANGCEFTKDIVVEDVEYTLTYGVAVRDVTDINGNCIASRASIVNLSGTPEFTIEWDEPEHGQYITGFPATHIVTVTDANGCTYTETVTNEDCTPLQFVNISASPNPANNYINTYINLSTPKNLTIDVYDNGYVNNYYHSDKGYLSAGNYNYSIDVSSYTTGSYYFVFTFDQIDVVTMQVIIQ